MRGLGERVRPFRSHLKRDGRVNDQQPGTVRVVLTGAGPDLIRLALFLERAFAGDRAADVLRVLGLAAIRITSEAGRGHRVTLTLQLEEASP